ncbi:MAG: acetyl-CoA carboxylase biotin carboxyl carrier protein subunit [Paludibacteraceae bacterium]|nr:acetyl-CoA carboxylase biotin carboxyl carrier protein subunit [Paludibacteraceae bacterium]
MNTTLILITIIICIVVLFIGKLLISNKSKEPRIIPTGPYTITATLPGQITKIFVTQGQAVKKGEALLTIEAMKMENEVLAERDCVITDIKVSVGQNVMGGNELICVK